jgi:phosphoribosyl 1,2-cyclic phosphodiesterase
MRVRFWGVRGSIPTPPTSEQIRAKILKAFKNFSSEKDFNLNQVEEYIMHSSVVDTGFIGGNTSCIEVRADDKILIFDMGSGLKRLGNHLLKHEKTKNGLELHIFMSHTHWDHILGLPFFVPAFFPNNKLIFYSVHRNLRDRLETQQDYRFFPVSLDSMSSKKEFVQIAHKQTISIGNVTVSNIPLYHPGGSFGFRVECDGKVFVYATDSEYKDQSREAVTQNTKFFRDADLLVFDAQYTFEESIHKEDWGHSSALIGVDFAMDANVKRLALFHHEPERDDFEIYEILKKSLDYKRINYPESKLEILLATEDLEIEL